MSEIEKVLEKEKTESEQVIPDDPLLEYFNNADKVLEVNYQLQKEKEELELENFKREYNLDKLADELDRGVVPDILEFYFGGDNEKFFKAIIQFSPNSEKINFIDFLDSDYGSRLMHENNLSIHIESGNLYYNCLNTGESFYDFVLSQRVKCKALL